ncbi:ATP-grasp domain-containing protein [Salinimonas marina]|uniref:ATP-grasp domain-containing protein n=1 Tax=Salinimonas marina TaxID=2785918 RepID=A0A7S9HCC1_9ALTE|nr:ATP-grasp domain-containing protein [Salinimonas marina]QPG04954.1 ATP-grasp domain-containing protein [Salinimonas marina]
MLKILISSSAAKIPMLQAIKQAASRLDDKALVVAGDSEPTALSQYFADDFWCMPAICEANLQQIMDELIRRQISHVVPSRDGELLFWARHSAALEQHNIDVICAEANAVEVCLDKLKFARSEGPVISASETLETLDTHRFVVKERFGAGSRSLLLNVRKTEAQQHGLGLSHPIYQPFIEGREISIDAWLDKHYQVKGHIYRYRQVVKHGESTVTQTVHLPQFDTIIRQFLHSLQLTGPVVLQAIIDASHSLHIIECNARFGGASTLGIKAGVDSFYWSLAQSAGIDLTQIEFSPSPTPITQIRYAQDCYL